MSNNSNIEEQFQNAFENFEADVNPQVWTGIEQQLPSICAPAVDGSFIAKGIVSSSKLSFLTAGLASLVLIGALTVSYFVINTTTPETIVNAGLTEEKTIVVPKQIVEQSDNVTIENSSLSTVNKKIENSPILRNEKETPSATSNKTTILNNKTSVITEPIEIKESETTAISNAVNKNSSDPVPSISSADEKHENISSPAIDTDNNADVNSKTSESFNWGLIPNAFSPNADGKNDVFKITNPNIETIKVTIIDRSGKQVHEWNGINGFWDGKDVNGNDLPKGVYYYFIFATSLNGEALKTKGTITLLR